MPDGRRGPGRKPVQIDLVELEKLCALQCTDEEIADWFDVSTRTIESRRKQPEYAQVMKRGRSRGRISVRRAQMKLLEGGNGTMSRKVGALEEAHGGTLFIDEIADMPRETQNKILRVLVDQTFQRVGGSTKVTVDVRIVSSTSRNIEADIAAGKFREDL